MSETSSDEVDLTEFRSRVAAIAVGFESALTDGYQRTIHAVNYLRDAQDDDGPDTERACQKAADAMKDARPEVPEEHREEWDDMIDALEGVGGS